MTSPYVKASEKTGAWTWIKERASALVLAPLMLWTLVAGATLAGLDHAQALAWLAQPVNAMLVAVGILIGVYHLHLGLRAIIEDYVHGSAGKLALTLNLLGCLALAGTGLAFVILIALAQAPAGA
ncbi:MAG: succinate dehydrogenase, hydrophobic membrane anchor protein [Caulobacterales bacterium]|nr:succinate dehydrogenase, hydrophobic membrane anchor protein [Caulobacterales bacterium]